MTDVPAPPRTRPWTLTAAAGLVWVAAAMIAVIGAGSLAQLHGRFSAGVGVMLLAYAALLGWVGWAAWRCRFYARGMLVGTGLLHAMLAMSSMAAGNVVVWVLVAVASLATVALAMLPQTTAALRVRRAVEDDI